MQRKSAGNDGLLQHVAHADGLPDGAGAHFDGGIVKIGRTHSYRGISRKAEAFGWHHAQRAIGTAIFVFIM